MIVRLIQTLRPAILCSLATFSFLTLSAGDLLGYELNVRSRNTTVQAGQSGYFDMYFELKSGSPALSGYMVKFTLTGPTSYAEVSDFAQANNAVFPGQTPQTDSTYPLPSNTASAYDWLSGIGAANPIANGAGIARVNFQTSAASGGIYAIAVDSNPANTTFSDGAGNPLTISNFISGEILILHTMTWNGSNGNWTDATWTGLPPGYPDRSADVVIDTPYTVTAGAAQQAHSIYVGGGGQLLIDGGTMAVTNDITGMGKISLHSGILTAKHIRADSLELAGGSKLILGSSSSGSGSAGASESLNFAAQTNQVPEPGTLMLLSTAVLFSLLWLRSHCFLIIRRRLGGIIRRGFIRWISKTSLMQAGAIDSK
jgi:hypothetical protein